jgi:ppGpp synthetase/RelA/SpoT-type nucleotidyltranferase
MNVYLDLDNTLIFNDLVRPHAYELIKQLKSLANVVIMTYGETDSQRKIADSLGLGLKVIGHDQYNAMIPGVDPILVDDPRSPHLQVKLKTLGIGMDRVVPVSPWYGEKGDNELLGVLDKVIHKLHNKEWVEDIPQKGIPQKQPFKSYVKARDLAEDRENKFCAGLEKAAHGHKVISDIKSEKSFKNKTIKRGKSIQKVFDILRGAILVDKKDQIDEVVKSLKKIFVVKKIEHKIKPEEFGYYGAVHVDVVVCKMICEIQVMTKKLWKYKMIADEIYHKYRGDKNPPKKDVEKSRELFKKGNED